MYDVFQRGMGGRCEGCFTLSIHWREKKRAPIHTHTLLHKVKWEASSSRQLVLSRCWCRSFQLRCLFSARYQSVMVCKDSSDSDRSSVRGAKRPARSHGVSTQNGASVLGFSAFRRATRMRQRKRMTREEYHRLKHMVPSVSSRSRVSKVQVIEEAIKYIDSLHVALFQRLKAQEIGTASPTSAPAAAATSDTAHGGRSEVTLRDLERNPILLRQWIERMMPVPSSAAMKLFQEKQNRQRRERCRELPSFLDRVNRLVKKRHN